MQNMQKIVEASRQSLLEQLEQLAPLADDATTGPWAANGPVVSWSVGDSTYTIAEEGNVTAGDYPGGNASFIAAARNLLTPANLLALRAALADAELVRLLKDYQSGQPAPDELLPGYASAADIEQEAVELEAADRFVAASMLRRLVALAAAAPAPLADAELAPGWIAVGECRPEPMADEVFGFDENTDEEERAGAQCSRDVLVVASVAPLPDGRPVQYVTIARYYPAGPGAWWGHGYPSLRVTHWQPLPATPTMEGSQAHD